MINDKALKFYVAQREALYREKGVSMILEFPAKYIGTPLYNKYKKLYPDLVHINRSGGATGIHMHLEYNRNIQS